MSGNRELTVKVTGDVSGVQGKLDAAGGSADKFAARSEAASGKVAKAFTGTLSKLNLAGTFGPVGQAIDTAMGQLEGLGGKTSSVGERIAKTGVIATGVGGALVAMAAGDERAQASLKTAIENTGGSWDEYKDKAEGAVHAQEHNGHAADDTQSALEKLTLATGDGDKALDHMQLTADLAAQKHISLSDAADTVSKILNGKGNKALAAYGITAANTGDKVKDAATNTDALAGKLQGQASAAAGTFSGKMAAVKAVVEDTAASMGQKYGPAITAAGAVVTVLGGIQTAGAAIAAKFAASHDAVAASVEASAVAEGEGAGAVTGLAVAEEGATVASGGLVAGLGSVLVTLGPIALALAAVAAAYKISSDQAKGYRDGTQRQNDADIASIPTTQGKIDKLKETQAALEKLQGPSIDVAGQTFTLTDASYKHAEQLDKTKGQIKDLEGELAAESVTLANGTVLTGQAADTVKRHEQAVKDDDAALKAHNDALRASVDPVFAVIDGQTKLKEAQQKVTDTRKFYKDGSPEVLAAIQAETTAGIDQAGALTTLREKFDSGQLSVNDYKGTLQGLVAQGALNQRDADEMVKKLDAVSYATEAMPKTHNLDLTVTASNFFQTIQQAKDAMQSLKDSGNFQLMGGVTGMKAYASGTTDLPDGDSIFNESGPEIIRKRGASVEIMSNPRSRLALSEAAPAVAVGGATEHHYHYNVTVQGSLISERDLVGILNDLQTRGLTTPWSVR